MFHNLKDLSGKTIKWARSWKNATHANMADGTKKHGNLVAIRFTDGSEFACSAAADSMDVVWCIVPPNDPKLSHGANNCKRGFAAKCKMKEQSPLAPARC